MQLVGDRILMVGKVIGTVVDVRMRVVLTAAGVMWIVWLGLVIVEVLRAALRKIMERARETRYRLTGLFGAGSPFAVGGT